MKDEHGHGPDMGAVDFNSASIKKRSFAPVIRPGGVSYPSGLPKSTPNGPANDFGGSRGRTGKDDVTKP